MADLHISKPWIATVQGGSLADSGRLVLRDFSPHPFAADEQINVRRGEDDEVTLLVEGRTDNGDVLVDLDGWHFSLRFENPTTARAIAGDEAGRAIRARGI